MRNSEGTSKVKTAMWGQSPTACPKLSRSPGRSSAVLPSARKNCPAGCKPQLAGAYCPPLCACFQQIHMLSWLNPYLLPSGRTEKQQVSYYRTILSLYISLESKQQVRVHNLWGTNESSHTTTFIYCHKRELIGA